MRRLAGLLLAALVFVASPAPATATSVAALSDNELVRASDVIVRGRVVQVEARTYDVGPQVFTEVTVAVEDALVGLPSPQRTVLVRIPGGQTDAHHVVVPGMPSLAHGDEVVLFLEALPAAFGEAAEAGYLPVGLSQGVWRRVGVDAWRRDAQEGLFSQPGDTPPARTPLAYGELASLCGAHPLADRGER